jgi:hypothetical protein
MHRDKPPGIFNLTDRSARYAAGLCFIAGFVLSILVRVGVILAREHFSQGNAPWSGS